MFELYDEQLRLEEETSISAQQKIDSGFISIIESGNLTETSFGQKLLMISLPQVEKNIKVFFETRLRGQYKMDREKLKLFYEGREQTLAFIVLNTMLIACAKEPVSLKQLSKKILTHINLLINIEQHKLADPKLYSYMDHEFKSRGKAFIARRKKKIAKLKGFDIDNLEARTKLGTALINVVIKSGCNIFDIVGGDFKHKEKAKDPYSVSLSDNAMKLIASQREALITNAFTYQPLVVKPGRPVSLHNTGGYITFDNIPLVKSYRNQRRLLEDSFNMNGRLMDVIHHIQQTPWQINTRVLDVMDEVISNNIRDPQSTEINPKLFGGIPYMEYLNADEMVPRKDFGPMDADGMFLDTKDFKAWYKAREEQRGIIETIQGRRMNYLLALSKAKKYRAYDRFYYTYQFDYRMRLYPIQQHLNPQMHSNIKALLQFADGQILNKEGLKWFKIHGANCYGYDKAPYDERIKAIDEREEEIKAIAKDPLEMYKLWAYTDSPYEYLAFCFAYADYLADNNAFIHIPVALDATCSGLQIFSGLLRDAKGAKSVNVIGDTRQDVYQDVADVANRLLAEGSYPKQVPHKTSDGEERMVSTNREARSLQGKITRKLTKTPVMTTVYSVTDRGIQEQIQDFLTDAELNGGKFWEGDKWIVNKVLKAVIIQAISMVVQGATDGQNYIKDKTREMTSENNYLLWNTPIFDIPMLQKIDKTKQVRVETELGRLLIKKPTDKINSAKMLSSVSPNFVHQLDAMLMYRTVELCMELGVQNFWLIHDSYGVSPNDAAVLGKNVRLAFKELFEQDVLKDWTEQLGLEYDENIMINTLDFNDVLESKYMFS